MGFDSVIENLQCQGIVHAGGRRVVEDLVIDGVCGSARYDAQTESTNSLAMSDLQRDGFQVDQLPRLYLADSQTAGRGRLGRKWISDETTLTFSLVVSTVAFLETSNLLSLAVGVGVARAIEHSFAPFRSSLKWPNDVYLGGAKVAGILVEATQVAVEARVVGIGINVGRSPDLSETPGAPPATDLSTATGRPIERYTFLEPVVRGVLESVEELSDGGETILQEFRQRCVLTGNEVRLANGGNTETGVCRGVSDQGELLIDSGSEVRSFRSGEASSIRKRVAGD